MNLPPEILFDEPSLMRLKTIAESANESPITVIEALIHAAYFMPHAEWDKLLRIYKDHNRQNTNSRGWGRD